MFAFYVFCKKIRSKILDKKYKRICIFGKIPKISANFSINFTNWYVRGVEWDAVDWGDFAAFSANFSNIALGQKLKLNFSPNIFYLKNASPSKGLFVSETATLYFDKSRLGLYNQILQPLATMPKADMNWNVGLIYRL